MHCYRKYRWQLQEQRAKGTYCALENSVFLSIVRARLSLQDGSLLKPGGSCRLCQGGRLFESQDYLGSCAFLVQVPRATSVPKDSCNLSFLPFSFSPFSPSYSPPSILSISLNNVTRPLHSKMVNVYVKLCVSRSQIHEMLLPMLRVVPVELLLEQGSLACSCLPFAEKKQLLASFCLMSSFIKEDLLVRRKCTCVNPLVQCLAHRRSLVKTAFSAYQNGKVGSPLYSKIQEVTSISLKRNENPPSKGRKVRDRSLEICPVVSQPHEAVNIGNLGILDLCLFMWESMWV